MKVLLWEDIDKLGKRGDVVEIADGYARNHLFPKKLATPATTQMLRELERQKERLKKREAKRLSDLKLLAEKIESTSITIEVNTNEEGKLYGSITSSDICEALRAEGIVLEEAWVELEEPIKLVGFYNVRVNLGKDLQPKARVWIVSSKTPPTKED
jgi:large subunit ribosomal protein L9